MAEYRPHRERQLPAIVPSNLAVPETARHHFGLGVEPAKLQRVLVLGCVPSHRFLRRPSGISDYDINGTVYQTRDPTRLVARRRNRGPTAFGEQVRDQDDRSRHLCERFFDAFHQQRRHEAGEKTARPNDHRIELRDRIGNNRVNGDFRL